MKTRLICLLMSCVLLVSAITVSAVNGSPYEQLKNAILDALFYDNFTMEAEYTVRVNGVIEEGERVFYSQGNNAILAIESSYYTELPLWYYTETVFTTVSALEFKEYKYTIPPVLVTTSEGSFYYIEDKIIHEIEPFNQKGDFVEMDMVYRTPNIALGKSMWASPTLYGVNVYNPADYDYCCYPNNEFNWRLADDIFYGKDEIQRDSNTIRFIELFADLFIGDLKNNISISTQDGMRSFAVEITGVQIPEILRLMIDLAVEDDYIWIVDDRVESVTINRLRGDAKIDSFGNLSYLETHINLTVTDEHGLIHDIDINTLLSLCDVGTTIPQSPVHGVEELFTLDYMRQHFGESFGSSYSTHFSLDEHGNIDMDSIDRWD